MAETCIGNWLKGRTRHEFVIATKARGKMGQGPNDEGLSRAHLMQAAAFSPASIAGTSLRPTRAALAMTACSAT